MKKFCILFSLLMSTMVFTACGAGIKYSSDSNSSGSKQTKNAELVDLGSDPQAYMLYGTYRNEEMYKDDSDLDDHADDYDYMTLQLEDSEEYEVQVFPMELQADTDFLDYRIGGKTDKELKEEVGLTDQQISVLHEYCNMIIYKPDISIEKNILKTENIPIRQIIASNLPMKLLETKSIWDWKP